MTTIYFIRHGEATGNRSRCFQGLTDNPLTERGVAQAEAAARRFADVDYDIIYTSPLVRAQETARLINAKQKPIIVEPELVEVSMGQMEGLPVDSLDEAYAPVMELWNQHPHLYVGPGAADGGSEGASKRLRKVIANIVEQHPDETVLISAHGFLLRIFNNWVLGNRFEQLQEVMWGGNTCVTCAKFDQNLTPTPVFINDSSHLPPELATADIWKK